MILSKKNPKKKEASNCTLSFFDPTWTGEVGLAEFERALRIDPNNVRALNHRGLVAGQSPERCATKLSDDPAQVRHDLIHLAKLLHGCPC